MYICNENVLANELDFKKALDLLNYLPDADEQSATRLTIWARAILRDAWTQLDTDLVAQSVTCTLFYKIIEFIAMTGKSHFPLFLIKIKFGACAVDR